MMKYVEHKEINEISCCCILRTKMSSLWSDRQINIKLGNYRYATVVNQMKRYQKSFVKNNHKDLFHSTLQYRITFRNSANRSVWKVTFFVYSSTDFSLHNNRINRSRRPAIKSCYKCQFLSIWHICQTFVILHINHTTLYNVLQRKSMSDITFYNEDIT